MNFANVTEWIIPEGDVIRVTDTNNTRVIWEKPVRPGYDEPFYVENITNYSETVRIYKDDWPAPTITIEYSTDGNNWLELGTTSESTPLTISLSPGNKVYLRANTQGWVYRSDVNPNTAWGNHIKGMSKVGGNIMSLLYGSSFTGRETIFPQSTLSTTLIFTSLFSTNTSLTDASALLLPSMLLTPSCYAGMFNSCGLEYAPELPATTLADSCYASMFRSCSSLVAAPDLPALNLVNSCYYNMFYDCQSLNSVKCLAKTGITSNDSTTSWLYRVSSNGTFTKAANINWPRTVSGIPSGWTVIEQ